MLYFATTVWSGCCVRGRDIAQELPFLYHMQGFMSMACLAIDFDIHLLAPAHNDLAILLAYVVL